MTGLIQARVTQLLAADPALRATQGAASRQRASAYQPELVVDVLEATYRDLLPAIAMNIQALTSRPD